MSSASTAATESSQSIMVVSADSRMTSEMPALSLLPISVVGSMTISVCRPFLPRRIVAGLAASPLKPLNWAASLRPVLASPMASCNRPFSISKPVTSDQLPVSSGADSLRKFRAQAMTFSPRPGL
ncbi:hypothetical protein D3C86_1506400 [compost metagenome]